MITCVCVTLDWPGGKVGRQESQCESSQAFSPRLAGFITATNHWPDKSSYFILPSFTSASLSFSFPRSFISLKPPSTPPPSCLCGSFACFTLHPAWLALSFPSQCNGPIFYFLFFFPPHCLFILCPYLYSSPPPTLLDSTSCSTPLSISPSLSIV